MPAVRQTYTDSGSRCHRCGGTRGTYAEQQPPHGQPVGPATQVSGLRRRSEGRSVKPPAQPTLVRTQHLPPPARKRCLCSSQPLPGPPGEALPCPATSGLHRPPTATCAQLVPRGRTASTPTFTCCAGTLLLAPSWVMAQVNVRALGGGAGRCKTAGSAYVGSNPTPATRGRPAPDQHVPGQGPLLCGCPEAPPATARPEPASGVEDPAGALLDQQQEVRPGPAAASGPGQRRHGRRRADPDRPWELLQEHL